MTGMMDSPDIAFDPEIQKKGAKEVLRVNAEFAPKVGINVCARATCVKPAGSTSCLLGTASGIHPHHARRYFRRVQANVMEYPLQYFEAHNPRAVEKSVWSNTGTDKVITFLCEVPEGARIKNQLCATDLLEHVKLTQQNWIEYGTRKEACVAPWLRHNVSNTITVLPEEWDGVEKFIYENRKWFAGISLLPASGDLDYQQAPFCKVLDYREIVAEGIKEGDDFKTLHMPGALRAPQDTLASDLKQKISGYENWEAPQNPHSWQSAMAGKLNVQLDQDKEPVITMPLYGQWHAATDELLYQKDNGQLLPNSTRNNWVHEVNLDPRYRTAAAMGTKVIQKYQEEFMDAAWQQLDELKLVNEKISRLQLAVELNNIIIKKSIKRFEQEQLLGFGNILSKKIKPSNGKTLYSELNQSPIPNAIVSNLFKKVLRNTWRIQKVSKNAKQVFATPLISGLNQQKLQISSLNIKKLNLNLASGIDLALQNSMAAGTTFKTLKPEEHFYKTHNYHYS
jgi:hypothetical protein